MEVLLEAELSPQQLGGILPYPPEKYGITRADETTMIFATVMGLLQPLQGSST